MTVKELITELLDCPMDAEVKLRTSNKDNDNRYHNYGKVGILKSPIYDAGNDKFFINLVFNNWELEDK